ncbi:MAG: phage holin family protein [Spirochaetes bacterium]|nr:phage holin family protein [Spirochaetota bacterium]
MIKLHLRIAKKELKKDLFRYITGIIFLIIAFFTVIIMFILSNILIILIFKYFIFNYFKNLLDYIFSIFATVIINFSFFLIIIISAFINFKKPFLKETKKAIKETLNDLK